MSIGDNMDKVYAMAYSQRAIQRFLSFDNREECPDAEADYDAALAWEEKRLGLTEDLAAANELLCDLLPPMSDDLRVLSD